jgi:hypothetical protein
VKRGANGGHVSFAYAPGASTGPSLFVGMLTSHNWPYGRDAVHQLERLPNGRSPLSQLVKLHQGQQAHHNEAAASSGSLLTVKALSPL